ncbi:hypothetical protein HBI38_153840 [Parastagonospora nodorum]|nr:hypothetical protein HBI41_090250 [Parastagonospora nodorum]KAH6283974.1 hypothetical protein HBI40_140700 [Parastagonospora nodorum]KAH6314345.1 hypothetical protein HBI38_153840 [Parastagonospora nodorum]
MAAPRHPPQSLIFSLKKAEGSSSWDNVEKHQPPASEAEIQVRVRAFQRRATPVYPVLEQIPSSKCRLQIQQLVEDESTKLRTINNTLRYNIASIDVYWENINHTSKRLNTVVIALETEAIWQEPISAPSMGVSSFDTSSTDGSSATVRAQPQNYATPRQYADTGSLLPHLARQQTHHALQPAIGYNIPHPERPLIAPYHIDPQVMPAPPQDGRYGALQSGIAHNYRSPQRPPHHPHALDLRVISESPQPAPSSHRHYGSYYPA